MVFSLTGDDGTVRTVVEQVADLFRGAFLHADVIDGMLCNLEIRGQVKPDSIVPLVHGGAVLSNNRIHNVMHIRVSPGSSPRLLAYLTARAMAKIVFGKSTNYLGIGTESAWGCREDGSAFVRLRESDSVCYGHSLEWGALDTVANYILARGDFSEEGETLENYHKITRIYPILGQWVELLSRGFGKPLMGCPYLDGFTELTVEISPRNLSPDTWGDPYALVCGAYFDNPFWGCAIVHQFHRIIDAYNSRMGEGAFQELAMLMDDYEELLGPDMEPEMEEPSALAGEIRQRIETFLKKSAGS